MKLPFDNSLRGSMSFRQLEEEVKRRRQSSGWSDDDNYQNRNSSNKGNSRYYKTDSSSSVNNGGYSKYSPATQNNSANHWFQTISKPLGFALVFIATAACFSIFCAILRKTRRRRNAIAERDIGDGGVGLGGEKAPNLLRGRSRSRTPARILQSSSQSPPQPRKYRGQSLPEYADEGERYPSRSSLPPSHGHDISADYVPMVDMHAPPAAPRTANNNKTPNRGRSRSRTIGQEDQRTRSTSRSRKRSVPPPPIVRLTRRT